MRVFPALIPMLFATTTPADATSPPDVLQGRGPATIETVTRVAGGSELADFYEFAVALNAAYENPFDPQDVRLDAHFRHESGRAMTVPGFFYVGYERSLDDAGRSEVVRRTGEHGWRVRFRPLLPGRYTFALTLDDGESVVKHEAPVFEVSGPLTRADFIQISPDNPLTFTAGEDQPFVPIGLNVAWPLERGSFDYDRFWARLAENGGNYARVWLAPTFNRLALERPAVEGVPSSGLGRIDQRAAMRVDHLVDLAEAKSLRLMLCAESFGNFRSNTQGSGQWHQSPYNAAVGGPLKHPAEFFTHPEARQLFRNRLRYIVARWGHSPAVFAWEFWNEVVYVDDYDEHVPAIVRWHAEMSEFLRATDPYDHLITTSVGGAETGAEIDALPGIDLIQSHMYGVEDIPEAIRHVAWSKAERFGKPHLFGEFGTSQVPAEVNLDTDGAQLEEMLWSALFTPTPATGMSWWWDLYIEPAGLWNRFEPISRFMTGVPTNRSPLRQAADVSFEFVGSPPPPDPATVVLAGGIRSWKPGPSNTPNELAVDATGRYSSSGPLSSLLHGNGHHPELHNPLTVHATYLTDGDLVVHVRQVSGYGGATLKVLIDGGLVFHEEFIDEDGGVGATQVNTEPLSEYVGRYRVAVPKGKHEIQIINDGADWIEATYELNGVNLRQTPWLDAHTLLIPTAEPHEPVALIWVRNREATWRHSVEGVAVPPVPPSILNFAGLDDGPYAVEWFDTHTGRKTTGDPVVVRDRVARVQLPEVRNHVALRLLRKAPDADKDPE